MDPKEVALFFKALGDENRVRILKMLQTGEKCACRLLEELNISQPTLSHHMKILCDVRIVKGRKVGKWTYYSLDCEGVLTLRALMQGSLDPEHIPETCDCIDCDCDECDCIEKENESWKNV